MYGFEVPAREFPHGSAAASLDFVNGVYSLNGSSVVITDFIVESATTDSQGLLITNGQPVLQIKGDLKTLLLTLSWTIIFELDINPAVHNEIMTYSTVYGVSEYSNYVDVNTWGDFYIVDHNPDLGAVYGSGVWTERFCDYYETLTSGANKFGMTRTNDLLSSSVNGSSPGPETDTNGITTTTVHNELYYDAHDRDACFGGWKGGNMVAVGGSFHIKTMTIYNPVSDEALRALTL